MWVFNNELNLDYIFSELDRRNPISKNKGEREEEEKRSTIDVKNKYWV